MVKVLDSCREKLNIFIVDFHVLGLFIPEKHGKKKSVRHAPLSYQFSFLKASKLIFWLLVFLGQLDASYTKNFDKIYYYGSCHSNFRISKNFSCMGHSR
jgi:hypothetical protein